MSNVNQVIHSNKNTENDTPLYICLQLNVTSMFELICIWIQLFKKTALIPQGKSLCLQEH